MIISRVAYNDMLAELAKLREESRVLNQQNVTLRSTVEWFMVRTTQLEKERAILVDHYMGVKLETPQYVPPRLGPDPVREVPVDIPEMLGSVNFGDMGNDAARAHGLDWDASGNVVKRG